ncbi:hypothetical protein BVC80_875g9 [Macleaya cordata]|uniref:Reverse transcriptase zinc-binding domain n=1 Tax=Macleaya cordata TaxID=56857 RepID=A0A200PZQ6_MACCD|nr:hypothetical protein BVC80_875g9 [Macleaya cordata]
MTYGVGVWRGISNQIALVKSHTTMVRKEGTHISFWDDRWAGNTTLRNDFHSLWKLSKKKEAMVDELINGEGSNLIWDLDFSRDLRHDEMESLEGLRPDYRVKMRDFGQARVRVVSQSKAATTSSEERKV